MRNFFFRAVKCITKIQRRHEVQRKETNCDSYFRNEPLCERGIMIISDRYAIPHSSDQNVCSLLMNQVTYNTEMIGMSRKADEKTLKIDYWLASPIYRM